MTSLMIWKKIQDFIKYIFDYLQTHKYTKATKEVVDCCDVMTQEDSYKR